MNYMAKSSSQFDQLYARRLKQLTLSSDHSERKWQVWRMQAARGEECCFRTEARYVCQFENCIFRQECLDLRADWKP